MSLSLHSTSTSSSTYSKQHPTTIPLDDDTKMLGYYSPQDYMRSQVSSKTGRMANVRREFEDTSLVKKFELTEEEYDKRSGIKKNLPVTFLFSYK